MRVLVVLFFLCSLLYYEPLSPSTPAQEETQPSLSLPVTSDTTLPSTDAKSQFFKILFVFALLVVLIFFIIWLIRFFGKTRPLTLNSRKNIKILERRPLSNQTLLYHLQIGDKQIVIAESKVEVKMIATLDRSETDDSS